MVSRHGWVDEDEASDDYIEHNVLSPTASAPHRQEMDVEN
jgi:hypothetical protein